MRLIDKDKLLEFIGEEYDDPDNDFAHGIYDQWKCDTEIIKSLPEVNGWISVKDRMPTSVANKVLVWLQHDDLNGYIGFGHYEKYKGQEIWYDLEHNEAFEIRGYTVTHWMPLPTPPEEKCNDD